ncbi:MAG: hypothetical protein QME42_03355 [bacterium]|nr:hypothetical protein [bacterium]
MLEVKKSCFLFLKSILIILIIMGNLSDFAFAEGQMLGDPGFEESTPNGTFPDSGYWKPASVDGGAYAKCVANEVANHSGDKGLWNYTGGETWAWWSAPYQEFLSAPGKIYNASAWIRQPDKNPYPPYDHVWVAGSEASVRLQFLNSYRSIIGSVASNPKITSDNQSWLQSSISNVTAPPDTAYVRFTCRVQKPEGSPGTSTSCFDDCFLEEVGTSNVGDNLWNFRWNGDDRFHSNEAWLRPWRYDYEDGWGRWVGNYIYELKWSGTYTQQSGNLNGISWNIDQNGRLSVSADRDRQWHAWAYVYVSNSCNILLNGGGDCVPRVFLNKAFDTPYEFPCNLSLIAGWNRIDITGYNQNESYSFVLTTDLVNQVDIMNSSPINQPPTAHIDSISPNPATQGKIVSFTGHGEDSDGTIVAYEWNSSINGSLSTFANFTTTALSIGTHTIFFKVKDDDETWSAPVTSILKINPPNQPVLGINPTSLSFGEVEKGKSKTMSFTITNSGEGTLTGNITKDKDWIIVSPTSFNLGAGENKIISVTVLPTRELSDYVTYTGMINITSNVGNAVVNISIIPTCVIAYPEPISLSSGKMLTFWGTGVAYGTIRIYTLSGELVKELRETEGKDKIIWNLTNENGEKIVRGIYLYSASNPKEPKGNRGKFTVVK